MDGLVHRPESVVPRTGADVSRNLVWKIFRAARVGGNGRAEKAAFGIANDAP